MCQRHSGNAIKRMRLRCNKLNVLITIPPLPEMFDFPQIAETFSFLALHYGRERACTLYLGFGAISQ